MKKFIAVIILLFALLIFKFYYNNEPTRVLRVGMECDYEPNNWEEKKESAYNMPLANKPGFYAEGYDLQIAKRAANDMNAKLEVYKIAWNDLPKALDEGKIDAVFSGMIDTSKRREFMMFSAPYDVTRTEYTVVVNKACRYVNAKTLSDFEGAKFIAQKNTQLDDAIDQIPRVIHMTPVETVSEMLDAVIKGEADGTVINFDTGRSYEAAHNNLKMIRFTEGNGFSLYFNGVCAGVRKGNTKLLKEINDSINGLSTRERQKIMDQTIARLWRNL